MTQYYYYSYEGEKKLIPPFFVCNFPTVMFVVPCLGQSAPEVGAQRGFWPLVAAGTRVGDGQGSSPGVVVRAVALEEVVVGAGVGQESFVAAQAGEGELRSRPGIGVEKVTNVVLQTLDHALEEESQLSRVDRLKVRAQVPSKDCAML